MDVSMKSRTPPHPLNQTTMGGKRANGAVDPQDEAELESEVRERDLVEAYVQEHALEATLNEVINHVVADRPADPFLVMSSLLYGRATAKRGIFHVECKEVLDGTGKPGVLVRLHTGKGVFEARCSSQCPGLPDRPESFDEFAPSVPLAKQRFGGQGYKLRAGIAQTLLVEKLVGLEPNDQQAIDSALVVVEGEIGRNFCLAASIAGCKAGAKYADVPLHEYIAKLHELPLENVCIPMPLFSVVNAGKLASNKLFVQEIVVAPVSATSFGDAFQLGAELSQAIYSQLESRGVGFSNIGAFGGFAPQLQTVAETFQIIRAAVDELRMRIDSGGGPASLQLDAASVTPLRFEYGIDFAASEFVTPAPPSEAEDGETAVRTTFTYNTDKWVPGSQGVILSSDELLDLVRSTVSELELATVIDPFDRGDIKAFTALMGQEDSAGDPSDGGEPSAEPPRQRVLGGDPNCKLQVVAKDLLSMHGLEAIQEERAANTILLQLDQHPTVSSALQAVADARRYGLAVILGASPGQSEAFLVPFAVGTGIGQVKFGGVLAADAVDRYNQLMALSEDIVPPVFVGGAYRR